MSLKQEQIEQIANLSRLDLDEARIEEYMRNMNSTLDYVDVLSKIPKEEFVGLDFSNNGILPLRDDIVKSDSVSTREELLACSQQKIQNNSIVIGNIMN